MLQKQSGLSLHVCRTFSYLACVSLKMLNQIQTSGNVHQNVHHLRLTVCVCQDAELFVHTQMHTKSYSSGARNITAAHSYKVSLVNSDVWGMPKYPVWEQLTVQANTTINTSQTPTVYNWIHKTLYLCVPCVKLHDYIIYECIHVSWVSFWCSILEYLSNYITLSAASRRYNCQIQDIPSEMSDLEPVC
jgi:hypothetical protein